MTGELEFWPEYGSGPLWLGGSSVDPAELLPSDLTARLVRWNAAYDDAKLPVEGDGDRAWLAEGTLLLREVRDALRGTYDIVVNEEWWE